MSYNDHELRGVGGWLAFFIVTLGLFTPLQIVVALFSLLGDPQIQAAYGESWPALKWTEIALSAVNLAAALFLAWRLNSVHNWQTIRIVIPGLWAMAVGIMIVELLAVAIIGGVPAGELLAGSGAEFVRPIVYCAVWTAYLLRSERVANTYGRHGDEQVEQVFA